MAQDIMDARRLLSNYRYVKPDLDRSLVAVLFRLSAFGLMHVSRGGLFSHRTRSRTLNESEVKRVLLSASEVKSRCSELQELFSGRPTSSELREKASERARILNDASRLVGQIESIWGQHRATKATFYVSYWLEKDSWGRIQASAKSNVSTVTGYAGRNVQPNTPEVAKKNLIEAYSSDIARIGLPWQAQPFKPAEGLAIGLVVPASVGPK